jgi:regulator of sigma E protease
MIMTIVVFILILSVLVLIHEFGHFIVAKRNGIRVEEFGWGLPPRLFGKKFGDTLYSINLLPFGGFVKLTGEDLDDGTGTVVSADPRSFATKTPRQRAAVLVAGVTMNLLLALVLFYGYFLISGFKTDQMPLLFNYKFPFGTTHMLGTVISDVVAGSPAAKAGLQSGYAIRTIDSVSVNSVADVHAQLKGKATRQVVLTVQDLTAVSNPSATKTINVVPAADPSGNTILGVYLSDSVSLDYSKPVDKIFAGPMQAYNVMSYSLVTFAKMAGLSYKTHTIAPVSESVSGPVGIYQIIGDILQYGGSRTILTLMNFVALMSLSLAFINIMPFPALDGGRVAFLLVEVIRKKPVNPKVEMTIHRIGMAVLMGFIVLVSIKDIFRF